MWSVVIAAAFILVAALHPHPAAAQAGGQRGHTRTGAVLGGNSPGMLRTIWGRVTLDDGTRPKKTVNIEMVCRGRPFTVAQLDTRGRFQFDVGSRTPGGALSGVAGIENGCVLQAALVGYRSSQVMVRDPDAFESLDVGTIVLSPVAESTDATVPQTTLQAPPKAQQAYNKALEQLNKPRPNHDKAAAQLEKAVAEYPQFAEAWNTLGEARMAQGQDAAAEAAFRSALAADPKLAAPYSALIRIELGRQRWEEAAMLAGNLLLLDPVDDQARFSFAVAKFNLGELEEARSAAEQVHAGSSGSQFPECNELLGHIHAKQGDFAKASLHYRRFLDIRPESPGAEALRARLAEWAALGVIDSAESNPK